jgi:hypothetical protein
MGFLVAGVVLCASAREAEGQLRGGRWHPPQGSVRTGVETPPPQPTIIIVVAPTIHHRQIFPCAVSTVASRPHRVIASNGVVLHQPSPPTYTQPVPQQQTSSQLSLPSAASTQPRTVIVSGATHLPCFTRDAAGRVVVFR